MVALWLVLKVVLFLCGFQLCRYIWGLFKQRWHYQKLIKELKMNDSLYPKHPIWGHIFSVLKDEKKLLDRIIDLCNSDGKPIDLTPLWIGPFHCSLLMSSPEYIKACVANADIKDNFAYDAFTPWIGDGLLTSGGPKWHRHRKLLTPAFHLGILKPYLNVFADCADILSDKFAAAEGQPIELFEPMCLFTLDSLLRCSFSYESNCQQDQNNVFSNAVNELSEIILYRFINVQYLNETIFKLSPLGRRFRKLCQTVHEISMSTIRKRRSELEAGGQEVKGRQGKYLDFMDILLSARDEDGKGMNEEEIREEVDTFMFAGHDTTSSAVPWLMNNLAKHPEYQQKCREEIQQLLANKDDEKLQWEDLSNLPYLTMCIKESLRLFPPVTNIMRKMVADVTLPNEAVVKKGTTVTCSIIGLHYNTKIWPNPREFNPERFTPENIKKRPPYSFLPFSAGPRNCIGQHFAMNEIKVVMVKILHRFHIDVDPDRSPIWIQRMMIKTWDGLYLKFTPVENM